MKANNNEPNSNQKTMKSTELPEKKSKRVLTKKVKKNQPSKNQGGYDKREITDCSEEVPFGVCPECRQKKTVFNQTSQEEKICSDCFQKRPVELSQLSPNFMDKEELEIWNKMSGEERQKYLTEVSKLGRETRGECNQCCHKDEIVIEFLDKKFCADCWKYQIAGMKSGIATCVRYSEQRCHCHPCQLRRSLSNYSTRDLMIEVLERRDFNAITTWEDDGFLQRFEELIVELKETEDFEKKREAEVHEDLFTRGKLSQRKKYSRGV